MTTPTEAAAAATFARRDQAQSLNAAREEQREICRRNLAHVLAQESFETEDLIAAVAAAFLDATPLADRISELAANCLLTARAAEAMELDLKAQLATAKAANALEVAALQAQREAEILAHRETARERDAAMETKSNMVITFGAAVTEWKAEIATLKTERDALREALDKARVVVASVRQEWSEDVKQIDAALATPTGEKP